MMRALASSAFRIALLLTTSISGMPAGAAGSDSDAIDPGSSLYAQRAVLLLERATENRDSASAALAHYQLGRHFNNIGLFSQAETHAGQAAGLVDRDLNPEFAIDIDLMRSAVLMRLGRGNEAAGILLGSLDEIDRLGLIDAGVRARITLSTLQSQAGMPEMARSTALAALAVAEANALTDWQARLLINLMRIELTMPAKLDRLGEPWMSRALQFDPDEFTDETRTSLLLAQLFYARSSGQMDEAMVLSDQATRQAVERGNLFLAGIASRETALLFCDQGALDQARTHFETSVTKLEQTDNVGEQGFTMNRWSDCEAAAGNFERALGLKQRGSDLIAEDRQRRQNELLVAGSLAFDTDQKIRELERLTAQETLLNASLARERWRGGALFAFSGLMLALLTLGWLRQRRLHDLRQGERRLARMRVDLLARTSHEIRNPAQGLAGVLESLTVRSPALTDDPGFKAALGSSRLITHLARDYLDLAMSEQDRLSVDVRAICETGTILASVKYLSQGLFPQAEDQLRLIQGDGVPERIQTDGDRLTQVLLNGVINAFRHAGSGPVTLRACLDEAQAPTRLRFEIEDYGPGFSCPDQRLFEPYWQAQTSGMCGTGLGLTISAAIVKRLGGTIEARNLEPHGAMLIISLPFEPLPLKTGGERPPTPLKANRLFPCARVVILDDDSFALLGLRDMVETLGCRARTGHDDSTLETWLAEFDPHLVILDQQLGSQTGASVARRIRNLDGAAGRRHRRILIVSGSENPGLSDDGTHDEWLLKPLSLQELTDQLAMIDSLPN